uniref:Uncharacterized protein n=1 Tax=Odontella aurita TaxID=265563 RepID=A0A7S4HS37_9STRA|mmetsp:Transcript_14156/g.41534  ORF Transcript_14156/g.41534 Transcript_14156/m.41534 type:complete len:579 (+) Transcript_14156:410-2146(+)
MEPSSPRRSPSPVCSSIDSASGRDSSNTTDDDPNRPPPSTPMCDPVSAPQPPLLDDEGWYDDDEERDADRDGIDDRHNPPCAGCANRDTPAFVFCCECGASLCYRCDARLHVADALSLDPRGRPMRSHRVERIVDGGGVPLLTSLMELGVMVAVVSGARPLLSAAGGMLNVDYFFESVCPAVTRLRRAVFRLDHALYPLLRGILGAWCDTEDAFIKIFVDVWVRGILTNTDSFALLLMKTPSALAAFLVVLTLAPFLAIPYALAATVVRGLENNVVPCWSLFRDLAESVQVIRSIAWAPAKVAAFFARCTILGLVMDADYYSEHRHRKYCLPPKTGQRRARPGDPSFRRAGFVSLLAAGVSRLSRIFVHYHAVARRAIVDGILTAVFLSVAVRIFLLNTPRCGHGILSALDSFVDESLTTTGAASLLSSEGWKKGGPQVLLNSNPSMQCVSIPALIRKWAERLGVASIELAEMGQDAGLLTSLQESTGDDYIDETLRSIARRRMMHLGECAWWVKTSAILLVVLITFAGVLRRIFYWADIRHRYSMLHQALSNDTSSGCNETSSSDGMTKEVVFAEFS